MNDKIEKFWMAAVMTYLILVFAGGTEEHYEKLQSGKQLTWPRF